MQKNTVLWLVWLLLSLALAGGLIALLTDETADRTVFVPGDMTSGHHQIELACGACHTSEYGDRDAMQSACEGCHADALKEAKDDHPKSKFTDPRNADRIAVLDARYCVACHVEHRPETTHDMAVTVPADVCYLCHQDIAEDRPSHEGMAFDTCASAGCHNFHDNRALYEDFLIKHLDEQDIHHGRTLLTSNLGEIVEQLPDYPLDRFPVAPVSLEAQRLPDGMHMDAQIGADWLASRHAAAGAGCVSCHESTDSEGVVSWVDKPDHTACGTCHAGEVAGFLGGKHGMRLDTARVGMDLGPMTPGMAMLPMQSAASQEALGCQSCHAAHRYDTATSSVEACLGCHADDHSVAYKSSGHYRLFEQQLTGALPAGSGVTCASCHMPRIEKDYYWGTFVHHEVQHNQSANLAPNEKMIRPVCLQCHGLEFSIDALADPALILNNFSNPPSLHVQSMDLARKRRSPSDP